MFSKTTIFVLFLTLICFIVWLFSDLVKTPASFTPDDATQKALQPLDPTFDQNTISQISKLSFELPPYNPRPNTQPSPTPLRNTAPSPSPISATASAILKLP